MRAFAVALFVVLSSLSSFAASARELPTTLLGNWVERGTDGSMRWTLEAERITVTPVDAAGKPLAAADPLDVLYQPSGDSWVIVVRSPSGAPLGEGRMMFSEGVLRVMLPAIGVHELRRS